MVEAGGSNTLGRSRQYAARGRPNWWVILAVSMALMALLAATSAGSHGSSPLHRQAQASDTRGDTRHLAPKTPVTTTLPAPTTGSTTTTAAPVPTTVPQRLVDAASVTTTTTTPPSTTTTVAPTVTSDTAGSADQTPADRTTDQGNLEPPEDASTSFGFQGGGAMEVSVSWGSATYLSLDVACTNGSSQSAGGSSTMAVSLPDAQGSCQATVSEPSSEDSAVSFTITIGPAGG